MFDGNVIYEMNPVGEINVPQEDKKPNMNDDGKGKISIANASSGGIRYVECHTDDRFSTVQCELSVEQTVELFNSGIDVRLKVFFGEGNGFTIYPLDYVFPDGSLLFKNIEIVWDYSTLTATDREITFDIDGEITGFTVTGSLVKV